RGRRPPAGVVLAPPAVLHRTPLIHGARQSYQCGGWRTNVLTGPSLTGETLNMGIRSVDLNLLVALDALLTERHVTRAAERTAVGQAAMSASLARLRKHFGDPLLVREG